MKLRAVITISIITLLLGSCGNGRHAKCDAYSCVENNKEIHNT
jgi:hypothetical protein